ncbi:hypothetical protein ACHMW6_06495 [Pseudoduganella sp. UC29_106]|uniref:hypothetical protein n=1 Tax=Pseudoduganella sp. UC29_106 TaxID=3374553 RepID=UPI0037562FEF
MSDIKQKYPASNADTVALTITLASLATDSNLRTGREGAHVDNRSNLDTDHLVSGMITVGTSPTAGKVIEVWAYAPISISSGTPTYPDVFSTGDAAKTVTSDNVKNSALRLVWSTAIDSTSDRSYYIPPTSIASLFGGELPPYRGVFVTHNTAVNLNSTSGNQAINYHRIQKQTV